MSDKICLLCARENAHAGVIFNIIQDFNLFYVIGFYDDNHNLHSTSVFGVPVLGDIERILNNNRFREYKYFICTGNNSFREKCYNMLIENKLDVVNIIHPSAIISKSAQIGRGVFIGPNVVINNSTNIGNGVIINTAATIDHDNIIEDFVNISPGCHTSGRVKIMRRSFLGTGSIVVPDITISEDSITGAGAVVIRNVRKKTKVVGVPAKEIS